MKNPSTQNQGPQETERDLNAPESDKDNAVTKALKLLSTMAELSFSNEGEVRLSDLVTRSGYARPTVHRLLATMKTCGYIHQDPSGPYQLGPRLKLLAQQSFGKGDIRRMALPLMTKLSEETGYTVHLGIRDGSEIVYIDKREPAQGLQISSAIGQRRPLQFTALGKAILAWSPLDIAYEALSPHWAPRTENSLTDRERLIAQFSEIRRQGYAVDNEESDLGFRCVAAPLCLGAELAVAAISMTTLSAQVSDTQLRSMGQEIARIASEISKAL